MKGSAFFAVVLCLLFFTCNPPEKKEPPPNVVFILADDLGYGDLSCFGQTKFQTPHIDALANGGLVFTQHYAGSTVCAPSRSALLTGQHTGHTFIRGNTEVEPEGQYPLPDSIFTLAELFKTKGYATGIFGKWGLGFPGSEGDPMNQGFDTFGGFNCQRMAHNYYPPHLWYDREKIMIPENESQNSTYAPAQIHQRALDFIEANKDNPFFLYMPTTIPHAELIAPDKYMEKYRGKFGTETPYIGTEYQDKNYKRGGYGSQPEPRAAFAAMMAVLDDQVGEIVQKLKALGLYENTVIIFTSDNGPHREGGADPDYFNSNGKLRGYKRDLYEGGIRVPLIVHWPAKIRSGKTNIPSAFWDFLPTISELIGADVPKNIDGISLCPTLFGKPDEQPKHPYLYWEFHELGGRQAIRKGKWKAIRLAVNMPDKNTVELYNMEDDIAEEHDLANVYPDTLRTLGTLMDNARSTNAVFKFKGEKNGN